MTVKIKVYSDFVCPFCFVGKGPLDEVIKERDVEVEWMPFELRPTPTPKIDPWNEPDKVGAWESFIAPTAKKFGVDMVLPRMSPHPYTHLAFEGCHFAKEHGKGNEFHDRVFTAFFQEEQNIEDIDVLTKLAEEVGLPTDIFKEALVTRKYKEAQEEALRHAYEEAQIKAVPTFIIGDQVIQGLASKERLAQAIEQAEVKEQEKTIGLQCNMDGKC
jgi:predicted DsbA family dithiol-disulfide isomerase